MTKYFLVRLNFLFFHTVHWAHKVWKNEKSALTEKKFRQIDYLVIVLVKPLLSRIFCQQLEICFHWKKKMSSNQLLSYFFSKTVTFTNFLPKMCESKFPLFPQCTMLAMNSMEVKIISHNFCGKTLRIKFKNWHNWQNFVKAIY